MATVINLQEFEVFFLSLKEDCCESVLEISMKCVEALKGNDFAETLSFNQVVSDYVWERLHTGHWKDVPLVWRQLHSATKLISALIALREGRASQALQDIDRGILMGAPILGGLLQKVASLLTDAITAHGDSNTAVSVTVDHNEVILAVPQCLTKSTEALVEVDEGCGAAAVQLPSQTPAGDSQRPHRKPIRFRNYQSVCETVECEGVTSDGILEKLPACSDQGSTAPTFKDRLYQKAREVRRGAQMEIDEGRNLAKPLNVPVPVVKSKDTLPPEGSVDRPPCAPVEPVPALECPSLEMFYCHCMQAGHPAVLKGCINHWPAYKGEERQWSLQLLKQKYGPRTVPVELGSRYTDDTWSQRLMTLCEFITEYIECPSQTGSPQPATGYLAQHQLFDQIPELKDDICTPEYCYLGSEGSGAEGAEGMDSSEAVPVQINAWFGPKGTVSPLHHDPEHNLLVQVMGCKLVWLFPSDQTASLYPHKGLLSNTSQVDAESPDLARFPLFAQAKGLQCTLQSGQALYIPPGCWHYVRALDVSFSVSFWWH